MQTDVAHAIEVLERTPRTLQALLSGLSDEWVLASEGPDTFSPKDVLGHLITGEEHDWIPRARLLLLEGPESTFEPFDRFAFRERYGERSVSELLELFASKRASSIDELRRLDPKPEDLERKGTHPELGRVTLGQLLATWVVHDLGHVRQVVRVMAKQYSEAVGPWTAYLTILRD